MSSYAMPIRLFEQLESHIGKEAALVFAEAFETTIESAIKSNKLQLKNEISEELKKELASKYDIAILKGEIDVVRKEIDVVRKEIDVVRKEIDVVRKEIEMLRLEMRKDLRITAIILIAVIVLLNQNSLEFIAKLFGLMK